MGWEEKENEKVPLSDSVFPWVHRLALPLLEVACAIQIECHICGQGHGRWGLTQARDLALPLPT